MSTLISTIIHTCSKSIRVFTLIIGRGFKSHYACYYIYVKICTISSTDCICNIIVICRFQGNSVGLIFIHTYTLCRYKIWRTFINIGDIHIDTLCTYIKTITCTCFKSVKFFCFIVGCCFKSNFTGYAIKSKRSTVTTANGIRNISIICCLQYKCTELVFLYTHICIRDKNRCSFIYILYVYSNTLCHYICPITDLCYKSVRVFTLIIRCYLKSYYSCTYIHIEVCTISSTDRIRNIFIIRCTQCDCTELVLFNCNTLR